MAFVAPAAAIEFAEEATAVRMTGSFFFLGWLLGLALWGRLASQRGWLVALCCIEICVAISGCATAAATSGHSYLVTRFLCGFAEGGVPTTSYGWAGEFLLPQHKPRAGIVLQVGFLIGSLCVTIGAYKGGAGQWRTLSAVISLAALPVAILCAFAPESPRWLRRAGYTSVQPGPQTDCLAQWEPPTARDDPSRDRDDTSSQAFSSAAVYRRDRRRDEWGRQYKRGWRAFCERADDQPKETFYNMRPQKPLLDAAEVEESNTNGGRTGAARGARPRCSHSSRSTPLSAVSSAYSASNGLSIPPSSLASHYMRRITYAARY